MEKVKFTHIDHSARVRLGLTGSAGLAKYVLADSIEKLGRDHTKSDNGWVDIDKMYLADFAEISRSTIFRGIADLIKLGILEKDDYSRLRTTRKWFENVTVTEEDRKKVRRELSAGKSKKAESKKETENGEETKTNKENNNNA